MPKFVSSNIFLQHVLFEKRCCTKLISSFKQTLDAEKTISNFFTKMVFPEKRLYTVRKQRSPKKQNQDERTLIQELQIPFSQSFDQVFQIKDRETTTRK